MRVRLWVPVALFAALAMVLSACGGSSSGGGGGAKKITIHFLTGTAENAKDEAEAKAEVDAFNKANPDIEVQRQSIPPDDVRQVLKTRLGSGSGPDVFTYDTGPGFGGVLAKAGLLAPLDAAYKQYNWGIYPWARARATYSGKTYGVPDQVEELGIFYNKNLFAKYNLQVPTTVDQLEHDADVLKQNKIIPFAFGDQEQWEAGHQFSMTTSDLLGHDGMQNILYGNGRWDDPKVVKGIDLFFHQFQQRGYFPKGATGIKYDDANALFYAGKAAMVPTGTWLVSDLSQKSPSPVGFFPFPSIDGSSISPPAGVGDGWFVSAKSTHQAAAEKFINFMFSPAMAKRQMEKLSDIPAFKVDTSTVSVTPLFKQILTDLSASGGDDKSFGENIDVLTPANFNDVMSSGFQDVLNGKRTAQQQAAMLEAAWEKAKKAGDTLSKP